MIFFLFAFLTPLSVDHVTVAGRNLEQIRAAFAAVGLRSEYGGPHANGLTEMDIVSFPDGSYIELMALRPGAVVDGKHYWGPYLSGDAGPCAWAARSEDVDAEAKRLRAAGIPVSDPEASGRTRTDGVRLEWQTAAVGTGRRGTFFPFLIRDISPRDKRVLPKGKPTMTEMQGVSRVILAVPDMATAVAQYQKAYGFPDPEYSRDPDLGARIARFPGTVVALAAADGRASAVGAHLKKFGPSAIAFVIRRKSTEPPAGVTWSRPNGWWIGIE